MKTLAVTQRVDISEENERRDSIDQRWYTFLHASGFLPLLIPNNPDIACNILKLYKPDGILLTGGNDLPHLGGNVFERDKTEIALLEYALNKKLPLLGVCRGMELIQNYFGVKLFKISCHVGTHKILIDGHEREVNSFHNYGTTDTVKELQIVARAGDGIVEAIKHIQFPVKGLMWHPERKEPFSEDDKNIFRDMVLV